MLSFKDYKKHILSESFGGPLALGVSTPASMGVMGGVGGTAAFEESLKDKLMALKGKAKAKFGGKTDDDEDETGDGEVVDASSEKDEPDVDVDGDDVDGGCNMCKKSSSKKSAKKSSKNMKKMSADMDDEEEVDDDDEEDAPEDKGNFGKDDEDEEGDGDDGEEAEPEDEGGMAANSAGPMFSKKKSGKKSAKKSTKKMKAEQAVPTEEEKWWNSVQNMLSVPQSKFGDGWSEYHEDSLLPPTDPNAAVTAPQPGQPGFAPQGRIGPMAGQTFEEWRKLSGK